MEGKVPGSVPGILPLVRHRDDISIEKVRPVFVATIQPLRRRWRAGRIALQPLALDVMIKLLRPQQSGKALAHHAARVFRQIRRNDARVVVVSLKLPQHKDAVELANELVFARWPVLVRQAQLYSDSPSRRHREAIVRRGVGAWSPFADGMQASVHDVIVDTILAERRSEN